MKNINHFIIIVFAFVSFGCSNNKSFTIIGNYRDLMVGDTVSISTIELPGWDEKLVTSFVIEDSTGFTYTGALEHDQYFILRYKTKEGKELIADRTGITFIARPADLLTLTGERETIFYSTISGGIYDEPQLKELLRVEDSLGAIRGTYLRNANVAVKENDMETANEWGQKFNSFYYNNPGYDRFKALNRAYIDSNKQGSLYLLVDRLPGINYRPIDSSKKYYEAYSAEIKDSWYGKKSAAFISEMESLAIGNQAPEFELITTTGDTITNEDYKGKYLLFYHWGLCPGSLYIDEHVCALYEQYKEKGLEVVGLTQSVESIANIYNDLQSKETQDDTAQKLKGMLNHTWSEAEFDSQYPCNKIMSEKYHISGLPYFVFISPEGTLLARDFHDAFYQAKEILTKELGE